MYTIDYVEHLNFTKKGNFFEAPISNSLIVKLGSSVTATIVGITKYGHRALTMYPDEKWRWVCEKYAEVKRTDPKTAWMVRSFIACSYTIDLSFGVISLPADFAEYAEIRDKGTFFQENGKWFLCADNSQAETT